MFWDYYYKSGDKLDPVVSCILFGILVLSLTGVAFYNYKQDKKNGK